MDNLPPERYSGLLWSRIRAKSSEILSFAGLRNLRPIRTVLLLGLLIRFILLPLSAHPWDVYVWYITGNRIYSGQPLYGGGAFTYSYPPVWAEIIAVMDGIYRVLAGWLGVGPMPASTADFLLNNGGSLGTPYVVDWLFATLIKLPLVLFDLLVTVLLYRVVGTHLDRPSQAPLAAALFFLNPFVIFISSVWGDFDVIAAYLLLLGLLLFLDRHPILAGMVLGLATATKYFPVVVVLIVTLAYEPSGLRAGYRRMAATFLAVIVAVSLPFLLSNGRLYIQTLISPAKPSPFTMASIWSGLSYLPHGRLPAWGGDVLIAAILVILIALGIKFRRIFSEAVSDTLWIDVSVLALLTFYLLYRTINDQYLVWIMPFLVLDIVRGRFAIWIYAVLNELIVFHAIFTLNGTSAFLPSLTLWPGFAHVFPVMHLNNLATPVLAVAVWVIVAYLFCARVRLLRAELRRARGRDPPVERSDKESFARRFLKKPRISIPR